MSDAGEILREIQRLAGLNRIRLTYHARFERMLDRGATMEDIRQALLSATEAIWQTDRATWKVEGGVDTDGDDLAVIVIVEADVVVVTLY